MGLDRSLLDVTDEQLNTGRIGHDWNPDVSEDTYISVRLRLRAEFCYVRHLSGEGGP